MGQGGTGEWGQVTQGSVSHFTSGTNGNRAFGSTGTGQTTVMAGATISGTGHVRGDLVVSGTLAPGDAITGVAGAGNGTLFIGNGGGGDMIINPGSVLSMQITAPSLLDFDLESGTYVIGGPEYEDYISVMEFFHPSTNAFPTYFGEPGTAILSNLHDHLEIGGGMTWNGDSIDVVPVSFSPEAGYVYNLMDWYGVSDWGSFSEGSSRYLIGNGDDNGNLNLPDLSAYPELRWDTGLFRSHGVLIISNIVLVPEPGRAMLLFAGIGFICFRRRR